LSPFILEYIPAQKKNERKIDGEVELAWDAALSYTINQQSDNPAPSGFDFTASFQLLFDTGSIKFFGKITDNILMDQTA
jgi:hypothetical protein